MIPGFGKSGSVLGLGLLVLVSSCRGPRPEGLAETGFSNVHLDSDGQNGGQSQSGEALGRLLQLDQVLDLAEKQGLDMALARTRLSVSAAEAQMARAAWIPELSFSADTWHNDGNVQATGGTFADVDKRNAREGVGISLELDLADALFAPRAANERLTAQRSLTDAARQSTRQRAAILFLNLLEAQFEVEIALEASTHAQELERVERARFEGGASLEVNYQRAVAHTAQVSALVVEADRRRSVAASRLALHLDLDPGRNWQAQAPPSLEQWAGGDDLMAELDSSEEGSEGGGPSLVERAHLQRPELAAAQARVRAARLEARGESRRWLLPTFQASLFDGEFGPERGEGSDSMVHAVGLSWNLALGMAGQAKRARAYEAQAVLELAQLQRLIEAQVTEARAGLEAAVSRHDLAQARLAAADAGARLAEERHAAGAGLMLEALAAQSDLVGARMAVARARVDRLRATWILARAVGQDR
ncbi:MAG: TolC family protein [bacterium]